MRADDETQAAIGDLVAETYRRMSTPGSEPSAMMEGHKIGRAAMPACRSEIDLPPIASMYLDRLRRTRDMDRR